MKDLRVRAIACTTPQQKAGFRMRHVVVLVAMGLVATDAFAQNPLPPDWPARIEIGIADAPGGVAVMKATAPFGFRY